MDYPNITSFKTVADFREYLAKENIRIGLADQVPSDGTAALARPARALGRNIGNRWAILPMEGWDCQDNGAPSEYTRRRWLRFATSGAKLLYGTEACAVMHAGRSNPQQLMLDDNTAPDLKNILRDMRAAHREKFGTDDDLVIGLQLTHSGRYAHPNEAKKLESVTAYSNPLLDKKFGNGPANVVKDEEIPDIIAHFVHAAELARDCGFDFVDIKSAHGYLCHEFLTAIDRPGPYGGSFENRTRFFREIADGIQKKCPGFPISARVSIFDIMPFIKGEDGYGHPMEWNGPYPYCFGGDGTGMGMDPDLKETVQFVKLLQSYGVDMICATIGSPYYCVHMQRPAYYPVADGYLPPENPIYNVSRHLAAVRRLRELCPGMQVVASGLSCLQEYMPNAAEYAIAHNEADFAGMGRMVLSYPDMCCDTLAGRPLQRKCICRTFGDCTNAPRFGMISGCYPLDHFYKELPEYAKLRECKHPR
ncbi:MAG: hypothetical protein IJJ26_11485 [Victivallales bacterium]|nr:hypothetical protein [Victivallales bacterium]